MNRKITKKISFIILISVFILNFQAVFAQDYDSDCVSNMKPFIKEKSGEMRTYLQEHFKSKKTNSSLLDLALERFDVYKRDLYGKYNEYIPEPGFELFGTSAQSLQCSKLVREEIDLMEKQIRSFFEQSSNVKTTSALMEKLKAINKKMDEMLKSIMQMYAKWLNLKGRIPCFIKNCT